LDISGMEALLERMVEQNDTTIEQNEQLIRIAEATNDELNWSGDLSLGKQLLDGLRSLERSVDGVEAAVGSVETAVSSVKTQILLNSDQGWRSSKPSRKDNGPIRAHNVRLAGPTIFK
jgi:hypothetical protein